MSFRPGSSAGRPGSAARGKQGTAAGRPPGTATRLTTGMAPGTARPGSRGGASVGGVALGSQVQVVERPMTQQGLGGPKTAAGRGPQRQVQDKTYFVGLLRGKINELTAEIHNLTKEIETIQEDQSSFVTYEKRAEQLASELKEHQGELADYNTLVDKMNTDDSIGDIQMEFDDVRVQNDREAKTLDTLFEQKQQKDNQIKQLEIELEQEKRMADNMVADMSPNMRGNYMQLKATNEHLLKQLESSQQTSDELTMKRTELDEELAVSPVKQEAVRLYEQLHELEEKRDELLKEAQSRGTPQEEREKLLKQVKEDNQEIASMDRQTNELREKLESAQDEITQLDQDLEENHGEKNQKYKELKKREETMNEFLDNFEDSKTQEKERLHQLEGNIVLILEHMSRNLGRFQHLPTPETLGDMKNDLNFKENEMKKSENTASGLAVESERLASDLQKVEQLEGKITSELNSLRGKIDKMTTELEVYSDLDKVKSDAEARKQKLGGDKVNLHKRKETFKKVTQTLASEYEGLQAQLHENETYVQLGNLERKWQHHEQNNFVMKEYISTKAKECDYHGMAKQVSSIMEEYNQTLHKMMSGKSNISDV